MLLTAEHISKDYGSKALLRDVTLYLNAGDKLGLIGINGTGKSTLIRILAGAETADAGKVTRDPNVQVVYLPQTPVMNHENTVLEQVFSSFPPEYRALNEYEARAILTRLGIPDAERKIGELSGGQRKRVALASVFVCPADVLILDEPTNHLDNEMVEWLEQKLKKYTGSIVLVTHDRYFLDRVTNHIGELSHGNLYLYEANYSRYLALKAERLEMEQASERKRQALLRREYAWIMRGCRARTTKSTERIARYETLKAHQAPETDETVSTVAISSRLGRKTVELAHVFKSFGGQSVIADFSYTVLHDDRIGIVGRNGAGKSTLLNLIAGVLAPDSGTVTHGQTVKIGYFTQEGREMDFNQRPFDYIHEIASTVRTREGSFSATQMMERFLFSPDLQFSLIGKLSGGERRRLFLLGILMSAPNILLLDEPTNDLDIETLTVLEDYLETFPGAVISVSHDRYFLNKIAENIFEVCGDGTVNRTVGNYEDYADRKREAQKATEKPLPRPKAERPPASTKKLRFSYREQKDYETIEADIALLEEALIACDAEIAANASDYVALQALTEKKDDLNRQLEEKMERWMYLNDLAERIAAQN